VTVLNSVEFYLAVSTFSLFVAFLFTRQAIGAGAGRAAMRHTGRAIRQGAGTFRKRRYGTVVALQGLLLPALAHAQTEHTGGGEANLVLPDLSTVHFFGMSGHALLTWGLVFCVGGLLFGLAIYVQLKNLPVHRTMLEISELIYETCKTYLVTQGKFIVLLWAFIAVIIALYFGWLAPVPGKQLRCPLFWGFRWSASVAVTEWRGSEFA
jgi:K(+)-stimulated pyrophosphate-energized sodium pump